MIATFLAPLALATLIVSDVDNMPSAPSLLVSSANFATDTTKKTEKKEEFEIPEEFRTPMLTMDICKRLAAVKKDLEVASKKHPELGGGSLGIAMQSKNYTKFEKSQAFQDILKKNNFTFKDFFHYYNEVVGALFILNVEKQLDQKNLTEAQGFKATQQSKNFVYANQKVIEKELKLGDTYIGEKPLPPGRFGGNSQNPFEPRDPREPNRDPRDDRSDQPMDPMNPFGT